jgi:hypothetical protein
MMRNDSIIISDITYQILYYENNIFNPELFGIKPTWLDDSGFFYQCLFELKDFKLYLKSFIVSSDRGYPIINGINPVPYSTDKGSDAVLYDNIAEQLDYNGALIIVNQIVNNYGKTEEIPCYCYKLVKEMVFLEGKLITTIDHSKAMLRIRKNLDLGLRRLDKKRDVKCIKKFLKASFAGEYEDIGISKLSFLKKRIMKE